MILVKKYTTFCNFTLHIKSLFPSTMYHKHEACYEKSCKGKNLSVLNSNNVVKMT